MPMRGVELPLASAEHGVAVPEWLAGVPEVGRRLEMMPVFVLWNSTGVFEPSVSVSSCEKVSDCHLRLKCVSQRTYRVAVIDFDLDSVHCCREDATAIISSIHTILICHILVPERKGFIAIFPHSRQCFLLRDDYRAVDGAITEPATLSLPALRNKIRMAVKRH